MKLLTCLITATSVLFANQLYAEKATILEQVGSPLSIENYSNNYMKPDRVGDGTVVHRVKVVNSSDQNVEAFGVGFYIFDSFNRDMGKPFVGYSMDPVVVGTFDHAGFEQHPRSAFLFENNGQGISYIAIVRMADGSIWEADAKSISLQIADFELQITGDTLE